MPILSNENREKAIALLTTLRAEIETIAAGDEPTRFQLRRYIAKRLEFDERGTPTQRRKLKDQKAKYQKGLCAQCSQKLPAKGSELHRIKAIEGYTPGNTILLCRPCHQKVQHSDTTGIPLP
ncbi:HNH endonuclease [Granulicella sibirica]|uniref:HNH nuclease domain-containing protein n=1 Tax=Granulicella sibirica TaxID=2479048 RepID=A0A4Q0T424_9BACT|nr:HNH endonuclease signature motif containing protein [Granulicella sibirica]RXH58475.1 hypothetical protein GRAN_1785 [Granulicella sibirica]